MNIAASASTGVDLVVGNHQLGRGSAARRRLLLELGVAVITGEVSGCQPREGWPIERSCPRLLVRFHKGRTAYGKLPRRCCWDPK